NQKRNIRLSNDDINLYITKAFARVDDEEHNNEQRLIMNREMISENNCQVVIEDMWIDKYIDLSYDLITNEIGNISEDILEYSDIISEKMLFWHYFTKKMR